MNIKKTSPLIQYFFECNYDTDYLEKVIIYGDGAKWITTCADYILKSEFRLDKFHLMKSILEATRTISNNRKRLKSNILKCLYENNKEMLIDLIDDAIGKLRGIQSNDGEEAFTRIAKIYYYQRTHYCKDSEVIKYTHKLLTLSSYYKNLTNKAFYAIIHKVLPKTVGDKNRKSYRGKIKLMI